MRVNIDRGESGGWPQTHRGQYLTRIHRQAFNKVFIIRNLLL